MKNSRADKKTIVLGASPNPSRFSYVACLKLLSAGYEVIPVGNRAGNIRELEIRTDFPIIEDIDTITLYVGPRNQAPLFSYIFDINPSRIIFNPGTENDELMKAAESRGIEVVE